MLFFLFAVILFFPKSNLYYLGEKELKNYKVYISNESVNEKLFGLELKQASLSYEGIEVAKIKQADILFLLVYGSVDLKNIELSSLVESYIPKRIDSCHISYSVIEPLTPQAIVKGSFGEIDAHYNLKTRKVYLLLKPSKLMLQEYRNSLQYFKKLKNGEYSYEKSL
jgi:hypothetical protein